MSENNEQQTQQDQKNKIVPIDELTIESNYWTPDNVQEFEEFEIVLHDGQGAFQQTSEVTKDDGTKKTVTGTFIYLEKDGKIKAGKVVKESLKAIKNGFGTAVFRKLLGKKVIATFRTTGYGIHIVWKPKPKLEEKK